MNAVNVQSTNNVKLDFKPTFTPSVITSAPATTYAGASNSFSFSGLAGATGYRSRLFGLRAAPFEGAEGPLTNVTLITYGGYPTVSNAIKASGSNSFRLRHVTDQAAETAYPQLIQFVNPFFVRTGAKIDFQSRLGVAFGGTPQTGPGEVARLEISADEGQTWTSIWSQAGTEADQGPDNSEKEFHARSVSLSNYVGKLVKLRFNFDVNPSVGWFDKPQDKYGWYIDDISITAADEAMNPSTASLPGTTVQFIPQTAGNYILQFGAVAGTRNFPWGPWHPITTQPAAPVVTLEESTMTVRDGAISMSVMKTSGSVTSITIQSATNPAGPWTTETSATVTGPVNNEYTVNMPMSGNARFYRVSVN